MRATMRRRPFLGALAATAAAGGLGQPRVARAGTPLSFQAAWVNDAEFIGYYVALDQGWYEAEGLDLTYHSGGPQIIPENTLLSGESDVALTTPDTTIKAVVEQGAPLKIIGAQYQKSPLGVVSLAESGIREPKDLIGRTLAIPPVNATAVEAMFELNGVDRNAVRIVAYSYDPRPLITGEIDASMDFTTNVLFTIEQAGKEAFSFLLYDYGLTIYNDTVVVTEETLATRRADLVGFLRASRRGWNDNFQYPQAWPLKFTDSWFEGNGRTIENELYFNLTQQLLMEHPDGIFTMTEEDIAKNIGALAQIGIEARRDIFDTTLLAEI